MLHELEKINCENSTAKCLFINDGQVTLQDGQFKKKKKKMRLSSVESIVSIKAGHGQVCGFSSKHFSVLNTTNQIPRIQDVAEEMQR